MAGMKGRDPHNLFVHWASQRLGPALCAILETKQESRFMLDRGPKKTKVLL